MKMKVTQAIKELAKTNGWILLNETYNPMAVVQKPVINNSWTKIKAK